ncbi:MAG: cell envelope biogenesis protein TolA [Methylocystaceae bacterium]|nr:cell envelope biogenesis protein TolA [Methylocystaceae bacterium]
MRFSRSKPGALISVAAHIGLFVAAMTLFANTNKFEDATEMTPVDVISDSELTQITKGERKAKELTPGPRVDKLSDKQDTPPEPPLNQAQKDTPSPPQQAPKQPEAGADRPDLTPTPPKRLASTKPALDKPVENERTESITPQASKEKPASTETKPDPEDAEVIKPTPPPRPKLETETKSTPSPPVKPKPRLKADELAKLLESTKEQEKGEVADKSEKGSKPKSGEENAPTSKFSAESILNLLTREAPQRRAATGQELRTASLGAAEGAAQKLSATMEARIAGYIHDHYHPCWASALTLGGATFTPVVEFHLTRDGALEGRPQLLNPSNNPVEQARGEQALQAVRRCSPMKIPDEFMPFYEQSLREITIRFQDTH